jgi:hypothetical protein
MNTLKKRQIQQGGSLIVGLLLMLVASIVTVASMRGSHLQEKMTSNTNNKTVSSMAAQAGASTFVEWAKGKAAANEWPTDQTWTALTDQPKTKQTAKKLTESGLGQYWFDDVKFTSTGVTLSVMGASQSGETALGESEVFINLTFTAGNSGGGGGGGGGTPISGFGGSAPAAISCFGGGCDIRTGSAGRVRGQDHDLPPLNCTGRACDLEPLTGSPGRPAVYASNRHQSLIGSQGGGSGGTGGGRNPSLASGPDTSDYCGLSSQNQTSIVCGNDAIWSPENYAVPPSQDPFFGPGSVGSLTASSPLVSSDFGTRSDPKITYINSTIRVSGNQHYAGIIIIDGGNLTVNGTVTFEGLILIKNCGVLDIGGTVNIYGAVVVDASTCVSTHQTFPGRGNMSLRYSSAALNNANNILNPGGGGGGGGSGSTSAGAVSVKVWREI